MRISINADNVKLVHSLQGLFKSKTKLDEIEIIAENEESRFC